MKTSKRVKIENNKLPSFSVETGQYFIWENKDSVASGEKSVIEISHLLRFDAIRLLNDGLGFE
jgi:hypothetical protein